MLSEDENPVGIVKMNDLALYYFTSSYVVDSRNSKIYAIYRHWLALLPEQVWVQPFVTLSNPSMRTVMSPIHLKMNPTGAYTTISWVYKDICS